MVVILRFKPAQAMSCLNAVWARALAAGAVGFALTATSTADVPVPRIRPTQAAVSTTDRRVARLEKFFDNYHCPTPYHTSEYLRSADDYGLDYRILPAISIRETLCGKTARQRNNRWGYHPGRETFPSIEAGIDFLAQRLTRHTLYRGKTLQDKLFTYNPRAAYPQEVERIMGQIE